MDRLISCLNLLRSKLERLEKDSLKETPTRTIIIDPILEALGWDVRDPDVVQLEYPTIDSKSVDYALKINGITVLLVEAKPLNDSLSDVKAITQVVGYAANDGIDWCILTNGVHWRVYKSSEKCQAPEKLLFEVNYNPKTVNDEKLHDIAKELWKFSRDEIAKGRLDQEGERVFNDGKVRKALDRLMQSPSRALINLIKNEIGDSLLSPDKIKKSLNRIWSLDEMPAELNVSQPQKRKKQPIQYDENSHLKDKEPSVLELFKSIDEYCMGLKMGQITKDHKKFYLNYLCDLNIFCSLWMQKKAIKVFLKLKYCDIQSPPSFSRDVSKLGHYGNGDFEITLNDKSQLTQTFDLIKQSCEAI